MLSTPVEKRTEESPVTSENGIVNFSNEELEEIYCFVDYDVNPSQAYIEMWRTSDILNFYWDYWEKAMRESNRPESDITKENCIGDWVAVHWAWKLKEEFNDRSTSRGG
jgi:hypothetical protein